MNFYWKFKTSLFIFIPVYLSQVNGETHELFDTRDRFDANTKNATFALLSKLSAAERRKSFAAFGFDREDLQKSNLSKKCLDSFKAMLNVSRGSSQYDEPLKLIDAWGSPAMNWYTGSFVWLGSPRQCSDVELEVRTNDTNDTTFVSGVNGILQMDISFNKGAPYRFTWEVCFPTPCEGDDFFKIGNRRLQAMLLENSVYQSLLMQGNVKTVILAQDGQEDGFYLFETFFFFFYVACAIMSEIILAAIRFRHVLKGEQPNASELWFFKGYLGRLLNSFGPITNIVALFSLDGKRRYLKTINGLKAISTLWVIAGSALYHTVKFFPHIHLTNKYYVYQHYINSFSFHIIFNCMFANDTFFVCAGVLLGYMSMIKKDKLKDASWKAVTKFWAEFYLRVYVRMGAPVIAATVFAMGIWKMMGNGTTPRWQPYENFVNTCKSSWWMNIFMIQNLVRCCKPCLPWTWFLACLFQLKLIAAPCLMMYKWKPRLSIILIVLLTLLSIGLHVFLNCQYKYAPTIYKTLPRDVSFEYDSIYADYIYEVKDQPYVSFMSFAPGLILGLKLYDKPPGTVEIGPRKTFIFWIVALTLLGSCFGVTAIINVLPVAEIICILASISSLLWSIAIVLIAYVTLHRRDWMSAFLSAQFFVIISKLGYWLYLLNPLVITFYLALCESSFKFTYMNYFFLTVTNFLWTSMFAVVFHLRVDCPIAAIWEVLDTIRSRREGEQAIILTSVMQLRTTPARRRGAQIPNMQLLDRSRQIAISDPIPVPHITPDEEPIANPDDAQKTSPDGDKGNFGDELKGSDEQCQ